MIRTIKQRIYVVGLMPLAILAVALLSLNGFSRIDEAKKELRNAQNVTAALLQSPAADALVVGNTLSFEQTVKNVIRTSPVLLCVILLDPAGQKVSEVGGCHSSVAQLRYFPVIAPAGGFSDFKEAPGPRMTLGKMGLVVDDLSVVQKRRQVLLQFALSLCLIAVVLALVGWLLRARLIEPVTRISSAMQSLSERDYSARVPIHGSDEITRLSEAVNATIATTASYTRELERRRNDADRALQDADEANLTRDGLVRSMTEDLVSPLARLHALLTEIAVANADPELKARIKAAIALLQAAQADFADLIEIAISARGARPPLPRDLDDILSDIEHDVAVLSAENISVSFAITQMPSVAPRRGEPTGLHVDIDAVRLTKALVYLLRLMARRCKSPGIYVTAEFLTISTDQLHISIHLRAFYDPVRDSAVPQWLERLSPYRSIPTVMGWTDRETKIVDYLLRAVSVEPTVNVTPAGAVSVLLDTTCHYARALFSEESRVTSVGSSRTLSATLVSNDAALERVTKRGEMADVELKLWSFSRALLNIGPLQADAALLIDMSDDVAEAVLFVDQLKALPGERPPLIAICPAGRITESLSERLLELGFNGAIQKPLQYSRLVEAIRATLAQPLKTILRNGPADQADGDR